MISEESLTRRRKLFGIYYLSYRDALTSMKSFPAVRIDDCHQSEAYKWCQDRCGDNWIWASPINTHYTYIHFMHDEDATAFRLTFEAT